MWTKGTFRVGLPKQSGKSRLNVAEHAGGGVGGGGGGWEGGEEVQRVSGPARPASKPIQLSPFLSLSVLLDAFSWNMKLKSKNILFIKKSLHGCMPPPYLHQDQKHSIGHNSENTLINALAITKKHVLSSGNENWANDGYIQKEKIAETAFSSKKMRKSA